MLKIGILGLPNVGKSTLFNAITKSFKAKVENYPFCTISPNISVVQFIDNKLINLKRIFNFDEINSINYKIIDIAGIVSGASLGVGLGSQFLSSLREVDIIIHVVSFLSYEEEKNKLKQSINNIKIIMEELFLSDLQYINKKINKYSKNKIEDIQTIKYLLDKRELIYNHINIINKEYQLLTNKPMLFLCNLDEKYIEKNNEINSKIKLDFNNLNSYILSNYKCNTILINSKLKNNLDNEEFMFKISPLIKKINKILNICNFYTANYNKKEIKSWLFKKGMNAKECSKLIHSSFDKLFIKAYIIKYEDILNFNINSFEKAKEIKKLIIGSKNYNLEDGDFVEFKLHKK